MTENEILSRSQVCDVCEFKIGNITPTCDLCACPITYLINTITAVCPKDKWIKDSITILGE